MSPQALRDQLRGPQCGHNEPVSVYHCDDLPKQLILVKLGEVDREASAKLTTRTRPSSGQPRSRRVKATSRTKPCGSRIPIVRILEIVRANVLLGENVHVPFRQTSAIYSHRHGPRVLLSFERDIPLPSVTSAHRPNAIPTEILHQLALQCPPYHPPHGPRPRAPLSRILAQHLARGKTSGRTMTGSERPTR